MRFHTKPSPALGLALSVAISCIVGCATMDDLAPPVTAQTLTIATSMGFDAQSVEQGRRLYVTECVRCHSPEAVTRYSREQWGTILPRMADEAEMNEGEEQALFAYIQSTLEHANLPQNTR